MDGRDKKNEMEQIQRGLEAFLNKELKGTEAGENRFAERRGKAEDSGTEYWEEGEFQEEYPEFGGSGENAPRERDIQVIPFGQEASGGFRRDGWEEADTETEAVDWDLAGRRPGTAARQAAGRGTSAGTERKTAGTIPPQGAKQTHGNPAAGPQNRPPRKNDRKKGGTDRKAAVEQGEKDGAMEKSKSKKKKPEKKKSRLKSALCKLLIVAVLIVSLLGFGLYQLVGLAYGKMTFREIASLADLPMKEDGVVNILLIGNDSRQNGEDGRSDAMILLSISSRTKTIYMTSLLRDMYVEIPGYNGNRLNAAYSFGGAELLMETIKENFDIPVNRYISVNFEAFANLVDAVGGIELELTSEEIEYVNGYLVEYNMLTNRPQGTDNMDTSVSGLVHLNGPQALAYSRNRYLGTDFGRTERQRKVLTAVIGKAPGALLTNAGGLLDGLMPNLTTNLTRQECFRLSLMAGKLFTYDIISDSIPQPGTYQSVYIREMAVLQVDFDTNVRYLKEKIYGE